MNDEALKVVIENHLSPEIEGEADWNKMSEFFSALVEDTEENKPYIL